MNLHQYLQKPGIVILLIWIFLTAINIGKPFQMDDGFHMEAARHIARDPLHPMSGMIRWDNDEPEPMYHANQPPLLFFMIAGLSIIFGFNEIVMHLMIAGFSFLALYWFYKACSLLKVRRPLLLVSLLGLCPAFVVSQNVMTDVPIMSLMIGAFYYLLLAEHQQESRNTLISIVLLTIGIFIKYAVLPVLAATGLVFILRKEYKKLLWLLIPLVALLLWSLWNYWEFGGSHLLSRKPGLRSTLQDRVWTFFTSLGCVAAFGVLFLSFLLKKKLANIIVYSTTALFLITAVLHYLEHDNHEKALTTALDISFFINGAMIILVAILFSYRSLLKPHKFTTFIQSPQAVLLLFIAALSSFLILFAPFMGIRHLLLIIPFLLLLAEPIIEKCNVGLIKFSLAASVILSLLLGISDWKYAFYYKNTASGIMRGMPPGSTVWATGTGAWQWYAQQNGMIRHSVQTETGKPGDYLVIARGLPAYRVSPDKEFVLLAKIWGEPSPLSYFCVSDGASLYSATFGKPGWKLSRRAIDTVYVCQYRNDSP